jgi:hypothetical protein
MQSQNYNNTINQLENITNITTTNQNWLIQIWNYITGILTNNINQINQTTTTNQQLLYQILNNTNSTRIPSTITYLTENCITGSNWIITTSVRDQFGNLMDNTTATCNIFTTIDNATNLMSYQAPEFIYTQTCPTTSTWSWQITCI